uniref:NADH-ubiquinone oxidoreductase chain 3 n=1 Tax=Diaphorina citri TaxID=121845 RepID=A0A343W388_DIACI|nr:NADH dehydrogenase subunit 3 [Diaphorina citri]AVV27757.1 NADH dehydrogenase subunit 3 [Diaphorina citri]AVV27763.1 NADH dehydrogenase subunit 3 [Diaphorina citri]
MLLILYFKVFVLFLLILMMNILPIMNSHKQLSREKTSPFECGFDPMSKPRISYSVHFFSIALMFLIFDIEITLIFPSPLIKQKIIMVNWMLSSTSLIMLLIIGLTLEWKEGSMNWK